MEDHMGILKSSRALWSSLIGALFLNGLCAAAAPPSEYQVKAIFLFNFAQFVAWPSGACLLPANRSSSACWQRSIRASLDEVVRGEEIEGRPLVVKRYQTAQEIGACHILFISRSESEQLEPILAALKRARILTVSDAEDAAARVMIRFMNEKNRIRLRINLQAARRPASRSVLSCCVPRTL